VVADLRIYSKALSVNEIKQLHSNNKHEEDDMPDKNIHLFLKYKPSIIKTLLDYPEQEMRQTNTAIIQALIIFSTKKEGRQQLF
jgi:hypothetical protein